MEPKFELTSDTCEFEGKTLYRIKALRTFGKIKKETLGGWLQAETNLSHDGLCWVAGEAKVLENGYVSDDAQIQAKAVVRDHAEVYGKAIIRGNALIYNGKVFENAKVEQHAEVHDSSQVHGSCHIYGKALLTEDCEVFGAAMVFDECCLSANAMVCGYAHVGGKAQISLNVVIHDSARVTIDGLLLGDRNVLLKIGGNTRLHGEGAKLSIEPVEVDY